MALTHRYVTTTGAGAKDGDAWASAFDWAAMETEIEATNPLTGYIYWIEEGTYSPSGDLVVAGDGTHAEPVCLVGVVDGTSAEPPTYSDWADGANRPLISAAGYYLSFDNYARLYNVRVTTDDTHCVHVDVGGFMYNCDFNHTYIGTATRNILLTDSYSVVLDCEIYVSGNPTGSFAMQGLTLGAGGKCINSYIHGSATDRLPKAIVTNTYNSIINTVFDNITTAVNSSNDGGVMLLNNTFNDCTTAWNNTISSTPGLTLINNIFNDCGTGVAADAAVALTQIGNNFFNSGTADYDSDINVTHPYDDVKKTAVDPQFTAEGGDNFSLGAGSGCIDAGEALRVGVG